MDENIENPETNDKPTKTSKQPKKGIVYLATIPPNMNVTRILEEFGQFGKVGRIYMQLAEKDTKLGQAPKKKRRRTNKFTEGWVEFERKSVAKKVASLLNNKQVSTRKKSKHYDCMWNIKYLPNFKWTHLNERLAYEKAARKQKLHAEITLAKKQTNFFTINLDKNKKNKLTINKEFSEMEIIPSNDDKPEDVDDRGEFLKSLFNN